MKNKDLSVRSRTLFGVFEDEELLTMDGYDDCIIGVVEQFGRPPIVCYDKKMVLAKLQMDGMSEDEAEEFWSFNQIGAWVGDGTPCFLTPTAPAGHGEGWQHALTASVGRVAGHISKPYTIRQIIREIDSGEYNAEMMLQHILRWVAANDKAQLRSEAE